MTAVAGGQKLEDSSSSSTSASLFIGLVVIVKSPLEQLEVRGGLRFVGFAL